MRSLPLLIALFAALFIARAAVAAEPAESNRTSGGKTRPAAKYTTELLEGRVVWLADALERRFGVKSVPEAQQRTLALESPDGALHPIVEDIRGRAFRVDKRLRSLDVQLVVRRYKGSPAVQVIRVYAVKKDGKYEIDYWCDICAIAMFELKDCECCQGPVTLRERLVEEGDASDATP